MNTATKCLFGGALVAAGLATHEAHAQEFVFIDTTASAHIDFGAGGVGEEFSGPGPWGLFSYFLQWPLFTSAIAAGNSTSIETQALSHYWPPAEVSVDSHFTVISNTFATLSYNINEFDNYADGDLEFTDLTTGTVLLSVSDNAGSQVFELLAEHEYRLSMSATQFGSANLTIDPPACLADFAEPFGQLNFFDVSAFLSLFNDEDPTADLNEDGRWNFFDVSAFINAFTAGCP